MPIAKLQRANFGNAGAYAFLPDSRTGFTYGITNTDPAGNIRLTGVGAYGGFNLSNRFQGGGVLTAMGAKRGKPWALLSLVNTGFTAGNTGQWSYGAVT